MCSSTTVFAYFLLGITVQVVESGPYRISADIPETYRLDLVVLKLSHGAAAIQFRLTDVPAIDQPILAAFTGIRSQRQ